MKVCLSLNFYVIFLFEIYKYDVDAKPLEYLRENCNMIISNIVGNGTPESIIFMWQCIATNFFLITNQMHQLFKFILL
jgi:hypothetical protein